LDEACRRVPKLGLKLDPVGIIRNLKADPYNVVYRHGDRVVHFHVKDILRLPDAEIEPPPGMGELDWGRLLGILYERGYDGYVCDEPHCRFWGRPDDRRRLHIKLTFRHLEQFLF
jgi:sugar phosphate isomerase/epimerase